MNKTTNITLSKTVIMLALVLGVGLANAALAVAKATKVPKADDDIKSPLGCRDVGYQYELKVLKLLPSAVGDRNSLYFFFNKLNQPITLYQMLGDDGARSMHLNHVVNARQWAALSTSEQSLKYICSKGDGKSTYGEIVDCADSIKVCEYARVTYGMNNRGNIWLVKSNTRQGAVQEVLNYGIIPR